METCKNNNHIYVSIIIPVYNVKSFVRKCVDSILKQSFQNFEIILVDDGSTDGSSLICDEIARIDSRIKVIHKINEGLGMARNTGIENSCGDYLSFIDSDDYVAPDMFGKLFKILENDKGDAIYFGMNKVINNSVVACGEIPKKLEYFGTDILKDFFLNSLGGFPRNEGNEFTGMSACCALYHRELLESAGIRFESERKILSEDIIFNLKFCANASHITICPQYFYYYVFRSTSLTKSYRADRFDVSLEMQRTLVSNLKKYSIDLTNEFRQNLYFLVNIIVCVKQEVSNSKDISYKVAIANIEKICKDEFTCKILNDFPLCYLSKSLRVWFYLIKKKQFLLLFILTKLQIYRC